MLAQDGGRRSRDEAREAFTGDRVWRRTEQLARSPVGLRNPITDHDGVPDRSVIEKLAVVIAYGLGRIARAHELVALEFELDAMQVKFAHQLFGAEILRPTEAPSRERFLRAGA